VFLLACLCRFCGVARRMEMRGYGVAEAEGRASWYLLLALLPAPFSSQWKLCLAEYDMRLWRKWLHYPFERCSRHKISCWYASNFPFLSLSLIVTTQTSINYTPQNRAFLQFFSFDMNSRSWHVFTFFSLQECLFQPDGMIVGLIWSMFCFIWKLYDLRFLPFIFVYDIITIII
jgi:hypothetical protein